MADTSDTAQGGQSGGEGAGTGGATGAGPPPDPWDAAVDRLVDSLRECVDAAKQSFDRVSAGTYDGKDLAGDLATMTARAARDWARLVVGAAGLVASAADTPVGRRSDTPPR